MLRTVVGNSMEPALRQEQIVVGWRWYRRPAAGAIVVVTHDGLEKIKRIKNVSADGIYVIGDNPSASTDSRSFGWLPGNAIQARIIWPWR